MPEIKNILPPIPEHFTNPRNIETFDKQNTLNKLISNKWYINNHNRPIVLNNQISLPIIRYGYYVSGAYDNLVGNYFRQHIYPIEQYKISTGLEAIYQIINGNLDIAFVNEELLVRFIKHDCKYLTKYIIDNLDSDFLKRLTEKEKKNILPEKIYPNINFSAIGVGYYTDFFLIVNNYSNILHFEDIQTTNKIIGIPEDSYYLFMKIIAAYDMDITKLNIVRIVELEELLENFKINKYDALFIITHPKNTQILKLSKEVKCRYIHIQKRKSIETRNNLQLLYKEQQGTNNTTEIQGPPDINRQMIYSKTLLDDLQTENITNTFNDMITKYFQKVVPKIVDLNQFHKSGNMYSYLETYTSRTILIIRNDIAKKQTKYLTQNYINELTRMKEHIDREQFIPQLDNFSSKEFIYDELLSFDKVIPLSEGSREVYLDEGMIKYSSKINSKI
jgi:hypothetical protein